ncbi:MAG: ABC transporter ATP-binding protein, partial [Nitratireductor sp.]
MSANKDLLRVENLSISIAIQDTSLEVVKNASFRIPAGKTVALVGESGSGKSIIAQSILGILPRVARITGGHIRFRDLLKPGEECDIAALDADSAEMRSLRGGRIAMIFQEPMTSLSPLHKVGHQVEEALVLHRAIAGTEARTTTQEMLRLVGFPDPARAYEMYPMELSGGLRQRAMIAMALICRPALLIADEPTTALDVTTQKQILKLIREIQERLGTSVLFITHDMGVVADIADRVYVMRAGEIVESGPIQAILTAPTKPYTRNLLTAVPALRPRDARPAASREIVLETSELGMTYSQGSLFRKREGTVAARDVNLILGRGRTLGIVGESGSGKSTVARCVMRLIEPTAGSIRLRGSDISGLSRRALRPWRKRIQMIFQDPNRSLNPRLTVGDSITEGPINYGTPPREAREQAKTLLELVGLPKDAIDRHPHQFSGGPRQRIAIAPALA